MQYFNIVQPYTVQPESEEPRVVTTLCKWEEVFASVELKETNLGPVA